MSQAVQKTTQPQPEPTAQRLSVVPAPAMRDFSLRVAGEYAVIIEAANIEDAMAWAQAGEWPERRSARLVEVGDDDNQLDFQVGL